MSLKPNTSEIINFTKIPFKVAVFSDVHGNLTALQTIVQDIEKKENIDLLVAAGDLLTDGPRPQETFDFLCNNKIRLLRGNHDDYLLGKGLETIKEPLRSELKRQTEWTISLLQKETLPAIAALPYQIDLIPPPIFPAEEVVPENNFSIMHTTALGPHDEVPTSAKPFTEIELEAAYGSIPSRLIAFGHSHQQFILSWQNKRLINVSSVSMQRDGTKLTGYGIFTWDGKEWQIELRRVAYPWQIEGELLRQSKLPDALYQLSFFSEP